jgi:WD40 repeat protein
MKTRTPLVSAVLLISITLSACRPSQTTLDMQATPVATGIFSTQPITLTNATNLVQLKTLGHDSPVWDMTFSPDGAMLASGSWSNHTGLPSDIHVWDLASGTEQASLRGHVNGVLAVAFNPQGTLLASGGADGTVRLWDLATGESALVMEGRHVTGGWTIDGIKQDMRPVYTLAFSPDGTTLAVGGGDPWVGPGSLELYDVATGKYLFEFEPSTSFPCCDMVTVHDLAFSPDGTLLATANGDGSILLWDTATGQERNFLGEHTGWASSVAFSPDGTLLASGGVWSDCDYGETCRPEDEHGEIRLWDVEIGEQLALLEGHVGGVQAIAFGQDGRFLVSAGDTVLFWDVATGAILAALELPTYGVTDMIFSPDGTLLATSGYDGAIRLWGVPVDSR